MSHCTKHEGHDAFCPSPAFPSDRVMDKDLPLGSLSVKQSQRVEVRECRE